MYSVSSRMPACMCMDMVMPMPGMLPAHLLPARIIQERSRVR